MVLKAYNFRVYPIEEQEVMFAKTFGCSRFVFNFLLGKQKKAENLWYLTEEMYQSGQIPENTIKTGFFRKFDAIKSIPKLKIYYDWLKEVDSIALQASAEDLGQAYERYYKKQNGRPKFKSKMNDVLSYTTKSVNNNIKIDGNHIKLPKIGWLRFAKSRNIKGNIRRVTVRKRPNGSFYISVLVDEPIKQHPKTGNEVGIDLGLTDFAAFSDGSKTDNPKIYAKLQPKLAKEQRKLSNRTYGSKNWRKQRTKVAKVHAKIANTRLDFLHKLTSDIIKNHDIIGIESLSVKHLLSEKKFSKSIADVSWSKFVELLTYKAEWHGRELIKVGKYFASSQICSDCGFKEPKVKDLIVRTWSCTRCGSAHDRDVNAAINILTEAKRLLEI